MSVSAYSSYVGGYGSAAPVGGGGPGGPEIGEPVVTAGTQDIYDSLPEVHRSQDAALGWPLKRWLSGVGNPLTDINTLIDRISYEPLDDGGPPGATSDLVDSARADSAWLPWLAQLRGVSLSRAGSDAEQRDAIASAAAGYRAGTPSAIAEAVRSQLTGTRFARVYPRSINVPGDGGLWDIMVITRASETPPGANVVGVLTRTGAKPAGVVVHHRTYESTWSAVQSALPTWAGWNGKTWAQIEEIGASL